MQRRDAALPPLASLNSLQSREDILVGRSDKSLERIRIDGSSRLQLYVTHVFAYSLQQAFWVRQ